MREIERVSERDRERDRWRVRDRERERVRESFDFGGGMENFNQLVRKSSPARLL